VSVTLPLRKRVPDGNYVETPPALRGPTKRLTAWQKAGHRSSVDTMRFHCSVRMYSVMSSRPSE
jgi:hypothetical protein